MLQHTAVSESPGFTSLKPTCICCVVNVWWTTAWCSPLLLIITLPHLRESICFHREPPPASKCLMIEISSGPLSRLLSAWSVTQLRRDNCLSHCLCYHLSLSHCSSRSFRKVTVLSSAPWQGSGRRACAPSLSQCSCGLASHPDGTVLLSESSEEQEDIINLIDFRWRANIGFKLWHSPQTCSLLTALWTAGVEEHLIVVWWDDVKLFIWCVTPFKQRSPASFLLSAHAIIKTTF